MRLRLGPALLCAGALLAVFPATSAIAVREDAPNRDLAMEGQPFLEETLYSQLDRYAGSGAWGINRQWERGDRPDWKIAVQRKGELYVVGGIVLGDRSLVDAGVRMLRWGFARQDTRTGAFPGRANNFHGTTFFIASAAHSVLLLERSPYARTYASSIRVLKRGILRTARWMLQPSVYREGMRTDSGFTHRYYKNAVAFGFASLLTRDRELRVALQDRMRALLRGGIAKQRPDGANPERNARTGETGTDSGYHATGLMFGSRWLVYFGNDRMASPVRRALQRGFAWQRTRIEPDGRISPDGNTRTCAEEYNDTGERKAPHYSTVNRAFAYRAYQTGLPSWMELARRVAAYADSRLPRC